MAKKSSGKRAKTNARRRLQYAALPYRSNGKTDLEVMLVTTRGTQRWIIPKGWPKIGLPPHRTAEEEAYEEAGVAGKVGKKRIGTYSYDKVLRTGRTSSCRVQVFPLRVTRQHREWPEKHQRQTRWYRPRDAARFVKEPKSAPADPKIYKAALIFFAHGQLDPTLQQVPNVDPPILYTVTYLFSFEGPQGDELAELNANATVVEKEFGLGNPGTCPMGEVAALVTSGLWKTANISDMAKQGACFI